MVWVEKAFVLALRPECCRSENHRDRKKNLRAALNAFVGFQLFPLIRGFTAKYGDMHLGNWMRINHLQDPY